MSQLDAFVDEWTTLERVLERHPSLSEFAEETGWTIGKVRYWFARASKNGRGLRRTDKRQVARREGIDEFVATVDGQTMTAAAEDLGLSRRALYYRLDIYNREGVLPRNLQIRFGFEEGQG